VSGLPSARDISVKCATPKGHGRHQEHAYR
jgi:hypothetical protein